MDIFEICQQKPTMKLTLKGYQCGLYRLNDEQYYRLSQNSLPIADDMFVLLNTERYFQESNEDLILPKIYLLLTLISGETSNFYDDWKGSFCFLFLIKINKK
ncbi:MAG: hypothetical protein F6K10_00935 [Moorea sp. SIO2B7]|nr:hypothetical protein [Moorena sp. SIO2B7]